MGFDAAMALVMGPTWSATAVGPMRSGCQRAKRPAGVHPAGRTCGALLNPNVQRRTVAIVG